MPGRGLIGFFLLLMLVASSLLWAEETKIFRIYTEEFPPYNYQENGRITGIATEVVREIMRRVGHPDTIKLIPWKRAYRELLTDDNVALYSMTRLPARESLFRWVGPLVEYRLDLLERADAQNMSKTLDGARQVEHVGVLDGGAAEVILTEAHFTNLVPLISAGLSAYRLLLRKHIDLLAGDVREWKYFARRTGLSPDLLRPVYTLRKNQMYLAFSRATPAAIIAQWQAALDAMHADGSYAAIVANNRW
jgi:polar amino acid transport system substrate-binding protein